MMGRNGLEYYRAIKPTAPDFTDLPVVVLTSSHSASGAEMFAAAVPLPPPGYLHWPADLR